MPPISCERSVVGLMTLPTEKTPSMRGQMDLAGVPADPCLGEMRTERIHPVLLGRVVLRHLGGRVGADGRVVAVLLAEGLGGGTDRGAP